jgi:histone H3/H4
LHDYNSISILKFIEKMESSKLFYRKLYSYSMEITLNPLKKMMKRAGAKRAGNDAAVELGKLMEERALRICKRAKKLAEFSGRRTVMRKDIRLAAKHDE